jgi:hypothetical protein
MLEVAQKSISYAVEQINSIDSVEPRYVAEPNNQIFGGATGMDSLNFAFFVISIEQYIKDTEKKEITLFDDYVFSLDPNDPNHPFATISSLTDYIIQKLS